MYNKNYKEYLGKVLTLEEMIKLFPDRWVVLADYKFEDGDLISGKIVSVCADNELQGILENIYKQSDDIKLYWTRTTDNNINIGVVW